MSNSIIETTVLPLHENTNDAPVPAAPVDSTAPAPKASRGKSPVESHQPPAAKPHCRHRVRTGAYCRLPVSDPKTGLCFRHASLRLQEVDSGDLSEALVCGIKDFHSAVDINHVLGELYKLLAANKISPRRGAVMAYTCSLLLRTLPAIDEELNPDDDQILFDLPRPKRDDDMDIPCAVAERARKAQLMQDPGHAVVNRRATRSALITTPAEPASWPSTPDKSNDSR